MQRQAEAPIVIGNKIYYYVPSTVAFWEGIVPTNNPNIFYLSGTYYNESAAIYKGPLEILDNYPIYNFLFKDAATTNAYGMHLLGTNVFGQDIVRVVGTYQYNSAFNDPTFAYVFTGTLDELSNSDNFVTIEPFRPSKFCVAHSTSGILAVYVVSDVSPIDITEGQCAIYDIEKNITITQILFPGAVSTTAYGIWYNGIENGYQSYTIAGGYSIGAGLLDTQSYIVDFLYNNCSGEFYFTNWTEIKLYKDIRTQSHVQGLTRLDNGDYICSAENYFIEPSGKTTQFNAVAIRLKRLNNAGFAITGYAAFDNPKGNNTALTSAASNAVVGFYINSENSVVPFQASIVNFDNLDSLDMIN